MKKILLVATCLAMLFHSCNSEHEFGSEKQDVDVSSRSVIGENASDPYRLESMQMALDDLAETYPELRGMHLQPTDYYVCFSPIDSVQVDTLLMRDIEVFYHPLDVMSSELEMQESKVLDEDNEDPLKIYTVVPADFDFPEGVDYEIIYGVFIQKDNVQTRSADAMQLSSNLYQHVLSRSLQLTGNISTTRATSNEGWNAEATILYEYEPGDFRPLPGVRVRAQYYTNISIDTEYGYTDKEGKTGTLLYVPSSDGYVNYDILWEHQQWQIRWFNTASEGLYITQLAVNATGPINITIDKHFGGGQTLALAGVHRGLYAYFREYYPLAEGLVKPSGLNVEFSNQYNSNAAGSFNIMHPHNNRIRLWAKYGNGEYWDAEDASSVVLHELGHASNYEQTKFVEPWSRRCESWAEGVSYVYMECLYPGYIPDSWDDRYTRVVECLLHQGLTLAEIQVSFVASSSWIQWRNELKDRTDLDDRILDLLFEFPNNYNFNISDFIKPEYKSYNKGEVAYFSLCDDVPEQYGVVDWEIVDGDGVILREADRMVAILFDEPGYKTVKASLQIDNNYIFTDETQVYISETDIFVNEGPNYNYDDIVCELSFKSPIESLRWDITDDSGVDVVYDNNSVTLYYETTGMKTVHFTVDYPALSGDKAHISVDYEREIAVEELPDLNSFELMAAPPYKAETLYRLRYKRTDEQIEILTYELNHYRFRIYTPFSHWSFDGDLGIAEFKIPGDVYIPIDYNVRITYMRPGHTEPSQAVIPVADYERAPYPPERDWF